MRTILAIAAAGLLLFSAAADAAAQARTGSRARTQTAPATSTAGNPYGLSSCADRPFARDCDRRGTW